MINTTVIDNDTQIDVRQRHLELYSEFNNCSIDQATIVFDYYQKLFLMAKLKDIRMSGYRETLDDFVNFRHNTTSKRKSQFLDSIIAGIDHNTFASKAFGNTSGDLSGFSHGMIRFLGLQYILDRMVDEKFAANNYTLDRLKALPEIHGQYVKYSSYRPSYFNSSPEKPLPDSSLVFLKQCFTYTYRDRINYLCESESGLYNIQLHNSSPFRYMFDEKIQQGMLLRIGAGTTRLNISGDNGVFDVKYWEL